MKRVFLLLSIFLLSTVARADWVNVRADHANLLYSEGEVGKFMLLLESEPKDPDYMIEARIDFTGRDEKILSFDEDYIFYNTPVLTAGEPVLTVKIHLVNVQRRGAIRDGIAAAQEQVAFWTERLNREVDPQKIAEFQARIAALQAQIQALEAELPLVDREVERKELRLKVVLLPEVKYVF